MTSRLLLEAGWGTYQARYRIASSHRRHAQPGMIRGRSKSASPASSPGESPDLISRMPRAPGGGGFNQSLIGTLANLARVAVVSSPARTT